MSWRKFISEFFAVSRQDRHRSSSKLDPPRPQRRLGFKRQEDRQMTPASQPAIDMPAQPMSVGGKRWIQEPVACMANGDVG